MSGPRRNDPCSCGSGKKYKQCHLEADAAARAEGRRGEALARLDGALTLRLYHWALERFGEAWEEAAFEVFDDLEDGLRLAVPFAVYHTEFQGRSALQWFVDDAVDEKLGADEWICLDGERQAWLSLWEVEDVAPGEGLVLRDRLSGQRWEVLERTASTSLRVGSVVLARLVELDGFRSINGLYPVALPSGLADEVERRARGHLRRKRDVPIERLQAPKACRYLVRRFEEAAFELEATYFAPAVANTDGDSLLFTTDHYALAPGARETVAHELAALEDVMAPDAGDEHPAYVCLGRNDVILGHIVLGESELRVEANSVERADALRTRLERACGDLVQRRARVHEDPFSEAREPDTEVPEPVTGPEADALVRDFKARHYAEWLDVPLPALAGATPREAASQPERRAAVESLLDDIERTEQRLPEAQRFDANTLRAELGIPMRAGQTPDPETS